MSTVLYKALAFLFIIFLGYGGKRIGFFRPTDYKLISKITLNITLPAAIISSFAATKRDSSLMILVFLGLACNIFMFTLAYFLGRKQNAGTRALYLINMSGYNIGAFTLPFVQNFFSPYGVVATCMFDTGNSMMGTGGAYALTCGILSAKDGKKLSIKEILQRLLSSAPFDTYLLMLFLVILGISIPRPIATAASTIGAANGFMAMLMLGTMFEIRFQASYLKKAALVLSVRYVFATLFALAFYFLTPFSLEIRRVLTIIVFAPIAAISPAFTEKCGGDQELSSFCVSVSILISICIMTALLIFLPV